jgi:hypothetical protein
MMVGTLTIQRPNSRTNRLDQRGGGWSVVRQLLLQTVVTLYLTHTRDFEPTVVFVSAHERGRMGGYMLDQTGRAVAGLRSVVRLPCSSVVVWIAERFATQFRKQEPISRNISRGNGTLVSIAIK